MFRLPHLGLFLILASQLIGCARVPEGLAPISVREMTFQIEFNAPINDNYYYFVAIDTSGGDTGPVPVFPGQVAIDGWVTGSATHYIQYNQGQYRIFEITSLHPFRSEPIGSPIKFQTPAPGGNTLRFTIDLNELSATEQRVDLNIIAIDDPYSEFRLLDALGPRGNDFLTVDISSNRTFANQEDAMIAEGPNDVLNHNAVVQQPTDLTRPLDITDWTITLNL